MTELERMLTDALSVLERELRQAQDAQAQTLAGQERTLTAHGDALLESQQQVSSLRVQQRESTQQLQRLSELSTKLEPLLTRVNVMLSEKKK